MAIPSRVSQRVRFSEFELDLSTRELWTNGTKQTLAPQPFQVLQVLIENHGQLVSRDALVRHLWPSDTLVDYEQGLKKAVNRLREALNDSAEQPRFIENLPRQGYRFIANLEFDTAVRGRSAKPIVVMPKPAREEPGAGTTRRKSIPSQFLWVSAVVILGVVGILFWRSRVSHRMPPPPGEPKVTQLTANSFENPVTSSVISPDGKYLAFTDNETKMRVRLLATGETQSISEPESLQGGAVDWTVVAWLPDGTRFIATARVRDDLTMFPDRHRFLVYSRPDGPVETPGSRPPSTWIVSVLGRAAQKLRDDAYSFSVSPDGTSIAFGTNPGQFGDREIWLMDLRGLQARKLFDAPAEAAVGGFRWSQDGQRAVYFQYGADGGILLSRSLQGGPAIPLVRFPDWTSLTDFVWLPDGRLIYANGCNFWELGIDTRSGKSVGSPRQFTNWFGPCVGQMSATSDGSRLAFQRWAQQTTVSVADLDENSNLISSPRHLTLNEYVNAAETWTPDSRALIFRSSRNGHLKLFRQALDSDTEEPLILGKENVAGSAFSPKGEWLFYLDCGPQVEAACEGVVPIMAISTSGGTPHEVLASNTYLQPRCPLAAGNFCVVAEQSDEGQPLIFTGFDALHGRGPELARLPTEAGAQYNWALSADGTRLAIFKVWDSRIHVISLTGGATEIVNVKHDPHLVLISWASNGNGWFTATKERSGIVLLYVDLQGESHPLWELKGGMLVRGLPSPDGRHLAVVATARNNNVWLMENF